MDPNDPPQPETSLGSVVTNGIQDISAFLPILGTEQCENHCCLGMDRGFLYVAATPLSIFGSLGIIKAGLVTLIISIDVPRFRGPRLLHNAGFSPPGLLKQLTYIRDDDDSIYVAEQNVRTMLRQHRVTAVVPNLCSRPWVFWNLNMVASTMVLSGLGILPYVYIITKNLSHRPFTATWMYPMLRVVGSALAAAMIQLIIQFRLMTIVHRRLTFHAVNHLFKLESRTLPTWWNPAWRSEDCLSSLRADINKFEENRPDYLKKRDGLGGLDKRFVDVGTFQPYPRNDSNIESGRTFVFSTVVFQILLVLGMAASIGGYIGCFKIVQSNANGIGPLVWLIVELALSLIRLWIWAINPSIDDPPPPIVISSGDLGAVPDVAHDIGWKLEDVTVDMHAVVIDIPNDRSEVHGSGLRWPMFEYLTKHLAVPEDQVKHVRGSDPTAIQSALHSLAKNPTILRGSPIIIYVSHYSGNDIDSEWIGNNEGGLSYSEFFELVRCISRSKGENVAVILDTNFPASGTEAEHESEHVLLTACSPGQIPRSGKADRNTGWFTEELLRVLESTAVQKLSYDQAVTKVTDILPTGQTPKCIGIFKERLIFNGILARKRPRKIHSEKLGSLISATFARPDDAPSRSTTIRSRGTTNATLLTVNGHPTNGRNF